MKSGQRSRTAAGTYRRERGDARAKNLRDKYPELSKVHGSTKLGTLKDQFGVDSLNKVRKRLRKK